MKSVGFLCFPAAMLLSATVCAQDMDLSGEIAAHSRLIDRGLSLSGDDPAVSGAIFTEFGDGFYGGVNLASVDDLKGNDLRLGGVMGKTFAIGAYEFDLSATLDSFAGEDATLYPELHARLSRDFGLFYTAAGMAYAPDGRWTARNRQTLYSYVETEVPIPRLPWLTATGHLGYEAVEDLADRTDWGLGLVAGFKSFALSMSYEDSDRKTARGGSRLVAALRFYF